MGNGTTRTSLLGLETLANGVLPGRTPGTLGWLDITDPDIDRCLACDTPGPVGTGGDLACKASDYPHDPGVVLTTLNVSLEGTARFLFTVGWADASNQLAKMSNNGREVQLGNDAEINTRARLIADRLMAAFETTLTKGPAAVRDFLQQQELIRDRHTKALQAKFANAQVTNQQHIARLGEWVKFFARVRFVSTVGVKVISAAAGGHKYASAVDIGYDTVTSGIDAYFEPGKEVHAVMIETAAKEVGKDLAKSANEKAANVVVGGAKQTDSIAKAVDNYRVDTDKLKERMRGIEAKIERSLEGSRTQRKLENKLAKANRAMTTAQKTLGRNVARKSLGNVGMLVFLKMDIEEAWDKMNATIADAER